MGDIIRMNYVDQDTLVGFAKQHGLHIDVNERPSWAMDNFGATRFHATLRRGSASVGVSDGCIWRGFYGNGSTESEALVDLARVLSEQSLSDTSGWKMQAPRFVGVGED